MNTVHLVQVFDNRNGHLNHLFRCLHPLNRGQCLTEVPTHYSKYGNKILGLQLLST